MTTIRVPYKPLLRYTPLVVFYVFLVTLCTMNLRYQITELDSYSEMDIQYSTMLDGCYHVYLDIGSNLGIQVRKLFEPSKYPEAKMNPVFDAIFGTEKVRTQNKHGDDHYLCVVGFEPNSQLSNYLKQVETSYTQCGWRVTFLTETAVSDKYGSTKFYTDGEQNKYEWGGGILPNSVIRVAKDNTTKYNDYSRVKLIRLSDFLRHVVGKRKLPSFDFENTSQKAPTVVMKLDIEGSEVDVIPDLLFSGGLEYVNLMMIEWHAFLQQKEQRRNATKILKSILKSMEVYSKLMLNDPLENQDVDNVKHNFRILNVDDETYGMTKYDLPVC